MTRERTAIILSARDETTAGAGDLADVLWRNLVVAAFLGAFGVCVGALVRNQIVAIVGLLVVSFAVEPTLIARASEVGRFGPTIGAPNGFLDLNGFGDDEQQLAPVAALAVMVGWVALGFTAGAALLQRRDLV